MHKDWSDEPRTVNVCGCAGMFFFECFSALDRVATKKVFSHFLFFSRPKHGPSPVFEANANAIPPRFLCLKKQAAPSSAQNAQATLSLFFCAKIVQCWPWIAISALPMACLHCSDEPKRSIPC